MLEVGLAKAGQFLAQNGNAIFHTDIFEKINFHLCVCVWVCVKIYIQTWCSSQ